MKATPRVIYSWAPPIYIDRPTQILTKALTTITDVLRILNPNIRVRFSPDPTTHAIAPQEPGEPWKITLSPMPLIPIIAKPAFTNKAANDKRYQNALQNLLGAGLHEIAHTLYSPSVTPVSWVKTVEGLEVLRSMEDYYINLQLCSRFPGAYPALHSNALHDLHGSNMLEAGFQGAFSETTFAHVMLQFAFYAYVVPAYLPDESLEPPTPRMQKVLDQSAKLREELTSGPVPNDRRRDIYDEIAAIIREVYPRDFDTFPQLPIRKPLNWTDKVEWPKPLARLGPHQQSSTIKELFEHVDAGCLAMKEAEKYPLRTSEVDAINRANEKMDFLEANNLTDIQDVNFDNPSRLRKYNENRELVDKLTEIFRMKDVKRTRWQPTVSGKLHARKIWRVPESIPGRVSKARLEPGEPDTVVMLLVDGSGSMSHVFADVARAANNLHASLKNRRGIKIHDWIYGSADNDDIHIMVVNPTEDHQWPMSAPYGGTPTFGAIRTAIDFLKKKYQSPATSKLIVHLSDLAYTDSYEYIELPPDVHLVSIPTEQWGVEYLFYDKQDNAAAAATQFLRPTNHPYTRLAEAVQELALQL